MGFWKQLFCEHIWGERIAEKLSLWVERNRLKREYTLFRITEKCIKCGKYRQWTDKRYD